MRLKVPLWPCESSTFATQKFNFRAPKVELSENQPSNLTFQIPFLHFYSQNIRSTFSIFQVFDCKLFDVKSVNFI